MHRRLPRGLLLRRSPGLGQGPRDPRAAIPREALAAFVKAGGPGDRDLQRLPGPREDGPSPEHVGYDAQEVSLIHNLSGQFEDRWVRVRFGCGPCVWTRGLPEMDLPVRHGEGTVRHHASRATLEELSAPRLVAARYVGRDGGEPSYPKTPTAQTGTLRESVIPRDACSDSCRIPRHSSTRRTTRSGQRCRHGRGGPAACSPTACGGAADRGAAEPHGIPCGRRRALLERRKRALLDTRAPFSIIGLSWGA